MLYFVDYLGDTYKISNTIVWIAVMVILAVYVVFYLLRSFGMYALTKRAGIKNAWLSFIPFAWMWVGGKLTKNARFFGMLIKKFHIWFFAVCSACQLFMLVDNFLSLFPLVGYYLQGGEIYIAEGTNAVGGLVQYGFLSGVYTASEINVAYLYNQTFIKVFNVFIIIFNVVNLAEIVLTIAFYGALFTKYFPQRHMLATILSLFLGLFAPFVFAIRNNEPVDYAEYMKKRYQATYGNQYGNPYGNPNQQNTNTQRSDEPFSEFKEKEKSPFEEFEDNDNFKN